MIHLKSKGGPPMSVYPFSARLITGEETSLAQYEGKVMLIVNTATKCGFTPQLKELQRLYEQFKDEGFVVLGFPCNQFGNQEPGTNVEITEVCSVQYEVQFPLFQKIDVKGPKAHPLFTYMTKQTKGIFTNHIKWNFTKFLINRDGKVIKRYAPITKPEKIKADIKKLL